MTTPHACEQTERVHALADGELSGAEADAVRDHLATCAACQAELAEVLQLDAAVAKRAVARRAPEVVSLAWYRRRRVQLAAVALAAAAGVAIYVALPGRGTPVGPGPVAIALAPRRVVEARLSWPGAAAYRVYDVPRAGEPPHEAIALTSLAALEDQGDHQGVGVLALLNGDRRQAAAQLERAGDSAGVLSDRAALALADAQPERALALADAALVKEASHGAALWNRALALRELGLLRAAAEAFRDVAARGEPGWADEARQRAVALDAGIDAIAQRFERMNRASVALAGGELSTGLSIEDVRAMPGFARGSLYDAIRSSVTPAQLAALQPLCEAVDAADRDTAMADALARAQAALHPALSKQYREMLRALAVERQAGAAAGTAGAARTQFLATLRAAHADDLQIGALLKLSADRRTVDRADLAEFAKLTAASPDPWMQLLGLEQQAEVALAKDDRAGAEATLLRARQRCTEPGAPAFRCLRIEALLGELYLRWQRQPDARAALSVAWQTVRASGEWLMRDVLLDRLAELALRGAQADQALATGPSLTRAYRDERARMGSGPLLAHPAL